MSGVAAGLQVPEAFLAGSQLVNVICEQATERKSDRLHCGELLLQYNSVEVVVLQASGSTLPQPMIALAPQPQMP